MKTEAEIKKVVRERYAAAATTSSSCCGPKTCGPGKGAELGLNIIGDAYRDLEGYVADADLGLGCGLPTRHAGLRDGDTVLDLGSGAGIDALVARRIVGESGQVIGVDMTPEMIARSRENAAKLGYANVEFRLGELEHLPVEAQTIDIVVSNCVLNLVPDKRKAFAEIFRVLKPGAHFCISDIVATASLPDAIREAAALYAGCVAGAMPRDEYLGLINETGFVDIDVAETKSINLPDKLLSQYLSASELAAFRHSGLAVQSVTVRARKPDRT